MCRKIQPKRKMPVSAMTAFFPRAEPQKEPNQVRDVCGGESLSAMLTEPHHIREGEGVKVMTNSERARQLGSRALTFHLSIIARHQPRRVAVAWLCPFPACDVALGRDRVTASSCETSTLNAPYKPDE